MRGSRNTPMKSDLSSLLEEGISAVQELAEEMRSWADGLEEKLSHTEKYDQVSNCADQLESVEAPDVPEVIESVACGYTLDTRKNLSRAARLANALSMLSACRDAAEDAKLELEGRAGEVEDEEKDQVLEEVSDIEAFMDEIDNVTSELENVDFPGMYS